MTGELSDCGPLLYEYSYADAVSDGVCKSF